MKISNKLKIGFSGLVGGTIAALADVVQKQEASAVAKIEAVIETHLLEGTSIPQCTVVLFLVLLAVALVFIFEAKTKIKAFLIGASILSLIMTFVPYEAARSLIGRSNAPIFRPVVFFAQAEEPELFRVDILLKTKDARPISELIATLRSLETGKVIARSKFEDANFFFHQSQGHYVLVVEVPGYRIAGIILIIVPEIEAEPYIIELEPTWVPLPIQRLLK